MVYYFIPDKEHGPGNREMEEVSFDQEYENEYFNATKASSEKKFTWPEIALTSVFVALIIITVVSINYKILDK